MSDVAIARIENDTCVVSFIPSDYWVRKNPDIKNNYEEYEKFAEDLWKTLEKRIPKLLKTEPFFRDVFYEGNNNSGWLSWLPFSVASIPSKARYLKV